MALATLIFSEGFDAAVLIFLLQGDSGGPMVVQREDQGYILSGITSWVIGCENFAVFTRVSEFRDWISQYVQF